MCVCVEFVPLCVGVGVGVGVGMGVGVGVHTHTFMSGDACMHRSEDV